MKASMHHVNANRNQKYRDQLTEKTLTKAPAPPKPKKKLNPDTVFVTTVIFCVCSFRVYLMMDS